MNDVSSLFGKCQISCATDGHVERRRFGLANDVMTFFNNLPTF